MTSQAYKDNYDQIDWSKPLKKVKKARAKVSRSKSVHVMGDIQPFVSPIDGTVISSRPQIREHEKRHNVVQVGNDLKNSRTGRR